MLSLGLGIAAFMLFFVYDINSYTRNYAFPKLFFCAGAVLLAVSVLQDLLSAWACGLFSGAADVLLLLCGGVSFAALIYCLFFALPFKITYVQPDADRCVYDGGVYALCRHPGVLCFFAMSLFWGIAALPGTMIVNGMVFSLLNLVYAWFQDRSTFPKTFCDYEKYRLKVPFLIPTRDSVGAARKTLFKSNCEEDKQ